MNKYGSAIIICLLATIITACSQYASINREYKKQARAFAKELRRQPEGFRTDSAGMPAWVGTVNFNMRKPNFVILHHTAQNSCGQTLQTFTQQRTQVSAHYVICKDGTIHHMLSDHLRAWHGGAAKWGNVTDINSVSIGIELDNNGFENFAPAQLSSLTLLLDTLKKRYNIPAANFIGHGDIAPTRKNDPNVRFPWQQFAAKGFGLWYGDTANINVPAGFISLQALRIIGYDVRDTAAAITAFRRHFLQDTLGRTLEAADKKILYDLYKRY